MFGTALKFIGVAAVLAFIAGYALSNSNINAMYDTCIQSHKSSYCLCKREVMKKEVNKIRFLYSMRAEGYRIISVSSQQCTRFLG